MHTVLNHNLFFVKEHIGIFKAANNFDILDPETGQELMHCREPNLGFFTKMFRFTDYKRMTPFEVILTTPSGESVLTIRRGVSLFLSRVEVFDDQDRLIGLFKQRFFSFGGRFDLFDPQERPLCSLKGKWHSWDFRFVQGDTEFAQVSKKWAGLGKELFTTADNYMLSIDSSVPENHPLRLLIVASVMVIDMVLKE